MESLNLVPRQRRPRLARRQTLPSLSLCPLLLLLPPAPRPPPHARLPFGDPYPVTGHCSAKAPCFPPGRHAGGARGCAEARAWRGYGLPLVCARGRGRSAGVCGGRLGPPRSGAGGGGRGCAGGEGAAGGAWRRSLRQKWRTRTRVKVVVVKEAPQEKAAAAPPPGPRPPPPGPLGRPPPLAPRSPPRPRPDPRPPGRRGRPHPARAVCASDPRVP